MIVINNKWLTPKRQQILWLIAEGYRNKEIARIQGVTMNTMRTSISVLFMMFGAVNRPNLIKKAYEHGCII